MIQRLIYFCKHPTLKRKNKKTLDFLFGDSFFSVTSKVIGMYGGGFLSIGEKCLINGNIILERPEAKVVIESNSFLGHSSSINSRKSIYIGSNVLIAEQCLIQDHNSHSTDYNLRRNDLDFAISRHLRNPNAKKDFSQVQEKKIHIGNDCWIGYRSIILKGVVLGERSIVGAGSVVTRSFPDDVVIAGNPAKIIKHLK